MDYVFEITDKTGRKIHLTKERWKHIQKHPFMHEQIDSIQETLRNPATIRLEDDEEALYFYKEFKNNESSERYLMVAVKYINNEGFVVTSFFTNKATGLKWKAK